MMALELYMLWVAKIKLNKLGGGRTQGERELSHPDILDISRMLITKKEKRMS